jgi:hypothetical protein
MARVKNLFSGRFPVWMPIVFTAIVYLASTAGRAVTDYDEGYYVQPALHMVESGDWVTPYVDGVRFLEKPPLLYWVTAASFKLFGVSEFSLRLPTALAVIALVWLVMGIARKAYPDAGVAAAGLSTAFSVGTYLFTRETLHDIWLVLFITLAMYAFLGWRLDPRHSSRHALLFYAAMAGAFLCKSLVGVAFPLGILFLFFLVSREWPRWGTLHLLPGSFLFLLLTVPWHWMAAVRNRGFLEFFFVGEQFLRFLGKREPPVLWTVPLWTFWALILVWFFPWTVFLPAAFRANRKPDSQNRRLVVRLAVIWAVVVVGFFSFSDRLEHYVFPALPAFSLFIAGAAGGSNGKSTLWAFRALAVLGVLVVLAGAFAGIWLAAGSGFQNAAAVPGNRLAETDFSILADMPPGIFYALLRPGAVTVAALAAGFWAALWFETRGRRMAALTCVAAAMMAVCGMTHWSMHICEDLISSKKFALAVAREAKPGDRLIVADDYESANSLNFYQPLRVEIVGGQAYALIPGMKFPDTPKIVMTLPEFQAAWHSTGRIFALLPETRKDEWNLEGTEMQRVLGRVLLRNF